MSKALENSIVWRSMLYVPSNNFKFIDKANQRGADAIILDLEDSVPFREKNNARDGLAKAVLRVKNSNTDVLVRINRPLTDAIADIQASVIDDVSALMLPKIDSPEHIKLLAEVVEALEPPGLLAQPRPLAKGADPAEHADDDDGVVDVERAERALQARAHQEGDQRVRAQVDD